MTRHTVVCAAVCTALVWASPSLGQYGAVDGEWRFYGADGGHTQYTPLDQIDAENVNELRIAWRWQAENSDPRPFFNFESTPIMIGGVLYTTTGASEVAAVDAATGQTKWLFTPLPRPAPKASPGNSLRDPGAASPTGRTANTPESFTT